MNGIIININPIALEVAGFEIRWYSIAILLAVAAGILVAYREVRRKGLDPKEILPLTPWLLLGGLIGARLFHVIDQWDLYSGNPGLIFQLNQGGLAIWGALIGGGIALLIYTRLKHIPLLKLLDILVPAVLVAQIIGRFGCIVNGDAYGGITDLPWGFIYTHPDAHIPAHLSGVATHPYPVYEMLWNLAALLLIYRFRNSFTHDGQLFLVYLAHYSAVRFVLTFVRQENVLLGSLQQAQLIAVFGFVISAAVVVYLFIKERRIRHAGS